MVALLAILVLALTAQVPSGSTHSSKASQEDDIREAVFRYQIRASSYQAFCISNHGRDPSDEFMQRLRDVKDHIAKRSGCGGLAGFFDIETGKPAAIISVNDINWLTKTKVEVYGGLHCGGLCGRGGRYYVEIKDRRWVVTRFRLEWVS